MSASAGAFIRVLSCVAVICGFVSGCAMQPIAPEKAASYKRVGVLSVMGDRFATAAVGVTVFGNESKEEALDFGADVMLAEKVTEALSAKYTVVDLRQYRNAFLGEPKYWPGQNRVVGEDRPSAQDVVRRLLGAEKLDAYIVITPASAVVRGTNQGVGGIGIVKLQRIFSQNEFRLHCAYIVAVVDGRDYSIAADMRALPVGESGFPLAGGSLLNAPNWPVPALYWEAPGANKDAIRAAFELLIIQSVPQTLHHAKLLE